MKAASTGTPAYALTGFGETHTLQCEKQPILPTPRQATPNKNVRIAAGLSSNEGHV